MLLSNITPVILTYNEVTNIGRCLGQLSWANRIVVVDSNSDDGTAALCNRFPNVDIYQRTFDCHTRQWNFAINETNIDTEWVLALDADYITDSKFRRELSFLDPPASISGYRARFDYVISGKRLRGSLYPPVVLLFRRLHGRYVQDGHTQRVVVDGGVAWLQSRVEHDDRKSVARWLQSQIVYAGLEAQRLENPHKPVSVVDLLRTRIPISWFLVPIYTLMIKGGMFDGAVGWFYAIQRSIAEAMICLCYLDKKLKRDQELTKNIADHVEEPDAEGVEPHQDRSR
jgi:glycosyltransferase involved in cell wall biosynthesis